MKEHYDTVSMAIEKLRKMGFTTDFNLKENCLANPLGVIKTDDFIIVDVYRYEGNSEPGRRSGDLCDRSL